MSTFQVITCILKDKTILVSCVHPLTKRKMRKTFASIIEANEYRLTLESRFNIVNIQSYRGLTLEELTVLFMRENPNSTFFRIRLHLVDFTDTFGHLQIDQITPDMLRTWFDQVQQENKLADTSMRSLKYTLDRLFEYLIEKEIISESPLREIYYQKTPMATISRKHLSTYEVEKLLDAVKKYTP